MSKNIMSVDLEDHFCDLPSSSWENFESRVVSNTKILLDLFEKYDTHATFFYAWIYCRKTSRIN